VVGGITGSDTIDVVGLCLGGALTMMGAAYLAATGDNRIASLTLLNTLIDHSEPGVLGVFTDKATVANLERKMAKTGYLEGRTMAGTFDLLRANDLIFSYVVSNWLMGEKPPAFDILAWNADSTRMPAAMHSFYLRSCYLENRLARGTMELAGHHLDLAHIKQDLYIAAAINDHIVPWTSSYLTIGHIPAQVRFVAVQRRPHRGYRQPARTEGVVHDRRDQPADRAGVTAGRHPARRLVVGGLDQLGCGARGTHGRSTAS
jgi:polyhydroxyalkanoate synthase subunit PhaC